VPQPHQTDGKIKIIDETDLLIFICLSHIKQIDLGEQSKMVLCFESPCRNIRCYVDVVVQRQIAAVRSWLECLP